MARMTLSAVENMGLIPEGTYKMQIVEVDDSKFEKFGKIVVRMESDNGWQYREQYSLMKLVKGALTPNEGALKAWSFFTRVAMNNWKLTEVDSQDLVGHWIEGQIIHETYTATKGEHAGEEMVSPHLKKIKSYEPPVNEEFVVASTNDLDDFLNS